VFDAALSIVARCERSSNVQDSDLQNQLRRPQRRADAENRPVAPPASHRNRWPPSLECLASCVAMPRWISTLIHKWRRICHSLRVQKDRSISISAADRERLERIEKCCERPGHRRPDYKWVDAPPYRAGATEVFDGRCRLRGGTCGCPDANADFSSDSSRYIANNSPAANQW
jgi:hypothetical protein